MENLDAWAEESGVVELLDQCHLMSYQRFSTFIFRLEANLVQNRSGGTLYGLFASNIGEGEGDAVQVKASCVGLPSPVIK